MNLDRNNGAEQHLLVLAPTGRDSKLAVELLRRSGFHADPCNGLEQFRKEIGSVGALIVADEALKYESVIQLTSLLESQPPGLDVPVIILTRRLSGAGGGESFPPLYRRANVTLLERPIKTDVLLSVVRNVLSARLRQYEVSSLLNTLEQKVQERDRFLAMLGHELRNPLSVISNSLILLDHSAELKNSRPVELATRQANVMGRLLDDLLDVARFANGKIIVDKRDVALSTVIQSAVAACGRNMLQKRQHFTSDIRRDVVVYGDPTRLTQLFSNILMNASKYTPAGGHIGIHCQTRNSSVDVSIIDDGIGIKTDLIPHLFEPFAQGEQGIERSEGGLGLGLAVAKSIAELHGGSIKASSAGTDCGSQFTVRLPITGADAQDTPAESSSIGMLHTGSLRIMVVEDDADGAESLQALLGDCGYEVHVVKDGHAAIAAASVLRPQVILMDIGLPGMNGYELAKELHKRIAGRMPLLVALSGYGRPEDLQRSREAGIDYHLVKPIQLEKLQRVLSEYETRRH